MTKKRVLGIVVPLVIILTYFFFNPLVPGLFAKKSQNSSVTTSEKKSASNENGENSAAISNELVEEVTPILTQELVENFSTNFAEIRASMLNFKLPESKDPSYEEVKEYSENNGSFEEINRILGSYGLGDEQPLKVYFTISNCYGIITYDKLLEAKPRQAHIIKKMAEASINQLRLITAPADLELVLQNFDALDASFKANVPEKK